MNIFEALRISHDIQRGLSDHLIQTEGDSKERKTLFDELKRELAAHAAAEERFFYVPLIAHDLTLVWCCMLAGTNKTDGFWVRARRKPQRYPQVSRGFATPPWRKRRGFMCQIACSTTLKPSRHGIAEHHQMDELVEELEKTELTSPGWLATAKQLHHKIHHHLEDEEQGVFQLAGKALTEAEKLSLAKAYEGEFVSQRTKK